MRIINTGGTTPDDITNQWEREQVYNGLDCCVTSEVLTALLPQLDAHTAATYAFSKALQGPILEMRLRGVLVDQARKAEVIEEYYNTVEALERNLERIVLEGVGMAGFNWRSNPDLHTLFYERLGIPPILRGGRPTVDRAALERLSSYIIARPIVSHMSIMRDLAKKIAVLKTELDADGRIRTSYNIAGTSTGRLSSSFSEFGTGGNLQNVENSLRSIFISDPGMKFAKFDAKSGESFCVGAIEWNLFNDPTYLNACESGDPHTAVARICWPQLPWTGDLKQDKDLAETPYYRHYTYRFMCKKLGHGSNYGGQPASLSAQAKLPLAVVADFQPKYFRAFPAHPRWHVHVDSQLRKTGVVTTLTGRKRYFFGRRNDPATLREAIAYDPQGSLADVVNTAMLRIWKRKIATLVMHDHDALTFTYPESTEHTVIPQLLALLPVQIPLAHGRTMTIPYDCKTGWNKGDWNVKTNPDGLKDYPISGTDTRTRSPTIGLLDRPIHRKYG
jgi:DNA polymerase I-like protein with 3'-5' exonuclease and polymerase domains